jgi:hypothetical protein
MLLSLAERRAGLLVLFLAMMGVCVMMYVIDDVHK